MARAPAVSERLAMLTGSMRALVAGLLLAIVPAPAFAARGRDLASGYEWLDVADGATVGPGFFSGTPVTLTPADNDPPARVAMPWPFRYQGLDRGELWISDNGWISFVDPGTDSAPIQGALPSTFPPHAMIAPFWSDLDCGNAAFGFRIRHGSVDTAGAYRIQWQGVELDSGQILIADLYLYQDGRIKLEYGAPTAFGLATIGIENDAGDDGFAIVDRGALADGVTSPVPAGYVIDILPPPLLASECSSVPATACGLIAESLPGAMPSNIFRYGCSGDDHLAREQVHAITLATSGRLRATLTAGTATSPRMYLVQQCSERDCIVGPVTAFDTLLGAGTYDLVVDALTIADEGSYEVQVDCLPLGVPLACGDAIAGDTTGGTELVRLLPCAGPLDLRGPESMFTVDLAGAPLLRATLTSAAAGLDVGLFRVPATGPITTDDCLQWGPTSVILGGLPDGQYVVVVDGIDGAAGAFTLETSCAIEADCSAIADVVDFATGVRQSVTGDTSLGDASVDVVRCDLAGIHDGKELVYEILLPVEGQVAVAQTNGAAGHSFFILDSCDESDCAGALLGSCGRTLAAGTHHLVVDSVAGSEGAFEVELIFDQVFNRWTECELPNLNTVPWDTERTTWNFNDGAYCISAPESINNPDGCTFAMYVTVDCGTEFHIPLHDVETGHVRVWDVLRGEYVVLTAVSETGWFAEGDDIAWEDCTGQLDAWNEVTTDLSFREPEGACGVYRLEFIDHSGFVWDLFANCTGLGEGGYPIFDSLCGAVGAFNPLPNLSLLGASATVTCPDVEVTYEIVNDGCAPATGVEVTLLDDGVAVAVDVIPLLASSSSVTRTFGATFPGGLSTANVTLRVDASDAIVECEEVPDSGCALGAGDDVLTLANCARQCAVDAIASAVPASICPGGSATIDATASTSVDCPGGALEYQLSDASGVLVPFQSSPIFGGVAPADTTDYGVEVRCADASVSATCVDAVTVPVVVDPVGSDPALLPIVGATLRVGWPESYSQASVPLRWGTDIALDASGGEHFHVLRSATPSGGFTQVNAPDPPLLQAPSFVDDAADQPDTGRALWCYLACVANACHSDNRLLDPSAP